MIRVTLVEDSSRFRSTLERFLSHAPGLALADSFGEAEAALEAARRTGERGEPVGWDLVLMDIELPGVDGIEATARLKRLLPGVKVVVLTVFENPETILRAICAGADGYLLKRARAQELIAAIRDAVEGGAPLTPKVARSLLQVVRAQRSLPEGTGAGPAPSRLDLTEREQEVLRALVDGLSYGQAAERLGIGIGTVRKHISAVYRKLRVHSAPEAVSRALRERLV